MKHDDGKARRGRGGERAEEGKREQGDDEATRDEDRDKEKAEHHHLSGADVPTAKVNMFSGIPFGNSLHASRKTRPPALRTM